MIRCTLNGLTSLILSINDYFHQKNILNSHTQKNANASELRMLTIAAEAESKASASIIAVANRTHHVAQCKI